MLSSAIKSDAFISYKKSCFSKMKSLEKKKVLYFCLRLLSQKCALQSFHRSYLRNCYRPCQILSLMFFIWSSIRKIKFMVSLMHRQIYITKVSYFNFSYFHIEPESGLIFKSISSLANLNSQTKFTSKFLDIKLLRKGTQEKLYFNNIVSIKSAFLANSVIWKT